MPTRDRILIRSEESKAPEIEALLMRIEDESVPERLLALATELQKALNARRRGTNGNGPDATARLGRLAIEG